MFNDKILKSVAEAVKQVLATEKLHPNQQKLDVHEPEKDKLTAKDFEMLRKGKKAPDAIKEEQVEEGWDDMMKAVKEKKGPQPSGGSGKKEGTRYGGSKQKDEKEKMKEEVEQLDEYGNTARGQKMLAKVQKRATDRLIKADDKNRLEPDVSKRDLNTVRKNAATAQRAYDRMEEEVEIDERTLTEPEMKKREEVVKSMKKGMQGFKQRYGDRAKEVMYATATKIAKKD